jgi:hypothetical protein
MITSASRSPMNDSRYARRRSITKGKRKQLIEVVNALKAADDKLILEEFQPSKLPSSESTVIGWFTHSWGLGRINADMSGVVNVRFPNFQGYPPRIDRVPNPELKGDLKLMLGDFTLMRGRFDGGAKHGYICMFVGKARLELIVSKWGATPGHHFYHWQAIAKGADPGSVNTIDDLSNVKDDEVSETRAEKDVKVMKALGEMLPFM